MSKKIKLDGIKLMARDMLVLREIEDYGFRTHAELRATVLQSYSRVWSWDLMRRLVRANLLRTVRDSSGKMLGWAPERKTSILLAEHSESKVERGKIPKYSSTFHHDREVRWVLDQLKKLQVVDGIVTDSKLKSDLFVGMKGHSRREANRLLSFIPDARFSFQSNGEIYHVALEVELSQKSAERIQSKFENYIANTNYAVVLYVCSNENLYKTLRSHYKSVLANSAEVKFAKYPAKIYFCLHEVLKENFLKTKFTSITDEFCFEDLRP